MSADLPDWSGAARFLFGPFELNIAERVLKKADEVIPLGARAYDILVTLIDRPGEVVCKNALIDRVWSGATVEEGTLRVHLSALRKALGDGQLGRKYIANVQGRGYSFVAPVTRQGGEVGGISRLVAGASLPVASGAMIGHGNVVLQIRARLRTERLITIVGVGGIGKTTAALAVGHAASDDFSGAVVFIDLSMLGGKDQVVAAIAAAMGLALPASDPEGTLLEFLRSRRALLILDNCEHLIEQAAEIADRISRHAADICLLATSREALQIAGEQVFRLKALDCPPARAGQTVDEILSYPAARLFVDRVGARGIDLELGADDAVLVAGICRRLDGIPLAIEFVARTAAIFGIRDTAARLALHIDLGSLARRTANPRHQTLRATLDWSYDLLSEVEKTVLRHVAIFVEGFTLNAVLALAEHEEASQCDVVAAVGSLVEKSMIVSRIDSRETSYRLLDMTRSYALEKLIASGERDVIATRYAAHRAQEMEADGSQYFDAATANDAHR